MLRLPSLVALLACVALSSAWVLPQSMVHQTEVSDVVGKFVNKIFSQRCPRSVEHMSVPVDGAIAHSTIKMNENQCVGEGEMTVLSGAPEAKTRIPADRPEYTNVIDSVESLNDGAIFAVEASGRNCGQFIVDKLGGNTVVVVVQPSSTLTLDSLGLVLLEANKRYTIVLDPDRSAVCVLQADRIVPSATPSISAVVPSPLPTPASPSPGPSQPVPSSAPAPGGSPGPVTPPQGTPAPTDDEPGAGSIEPEESSPEPTASGPSSTPEDDDGSVCFAADATVQLENGSVKRMDEVVIGDRVHVGGSVFSDVFMFTHKMADVMHAFVTLRVASGHVVSATPGHYLYVNGALVVAARARVGDVLELGNGARSVVVEVVRETKAGLFNPQTMDGDIVVNGIKATTFTETIVPKTAQVMLAPLRMLYSVLGFGLSFLEKGAGEPVVAMMPHGAAMV